MMAPNGFGVVCPLGHIFCVINFPFHTSGPSRLCCLMSCSCAIIQRTMTCACVVAMEKHKRLTAIGERQPDDSFCNRCIFLRLVAFLLVTMRLSHIAPSSVAPDSQVSCKFCIVSIPKDTDANNNIHYVVASFQKRID